MSFTQLRGFGLALAAASILAACGGQSSTSSSNAPAASAPASSSAAAPAAEGKEYKVAMNAQFPPFESMNSSGQIEGFDVDVMDAIAKEEGFKVTYHQQAWDGIFASLKAGDNDILISGITITDDRKKEMLFSEPYYKITQVVLVPQAQTVPSVRRRNDKRADHWHQ